MPLLTMKVAPCICITQDLLRKAGITQDEICIDIQENLIKISPVMAEDRQKPLLKDSPIRDIVAMDEIRERERDR